MVYTYCIGLSNMYTVYTDVFSYLCLNIYSMYTHQKDPFVSVGFFEIQPPQGLHSTGLDQCFLYRCTSRCHGVWGHVFGVFVCEGWCGKDTDFGMKFRSCVPKPAISKYFCSVLVGSTQPYVSILYCFIVSRVLFWQFLGSIGVSVPF